MTAARQRTALARRRARSGGAAAARSSSRRSGRGELPEAMGDLDVGRVARDAIRLQRIGTPLADVVREGVRYAAPRAEYGRPAAARRAAGREMSVVAATVGQCG